MTATAAQPQKENIPTDMEDRVPNGPVGAAILGAGAGCCALGILAVAADISKPIARWLTFYTPTGPLSGVSSTAILLWLVTWSMLARRWRTKTVAIAKTNALAFVLLLLGVLLTFPPLADSLFRK